MIEEKNEMELFGDDFDLFNDIAEDLESRQATETTEEAAEQTEDDASFTGEQTTEEDTSEEETSEETTEEDDTEETENSEDASSQDTQTSPFTPYAKFLVEEGILTDLDIEKFDGTADSLKSAMSSEISSGIEYYKNTLPPEVKMLVDNYEAGVPFDKALSVTSKQIEYSSIDEEKLASNEDLQKDIVREYYKKSTRLSDDKIEKQINRLSDLSELEEESKSSLTELMTIQNEEIEQAKIVAKQNQEDIASRQKEDLKNLEEFIASTEEIIPDIKISKQIKDKIKRNLTVPVGQDEYGNLINKVGNYRNQNPIKFEVILNYLFEATNEFKDWGVLGKAGKRTAIKEFEDAVKTVDSKPGNSGGKVNVSSSDLFDAIKSFNI